MSISTRGLGRRLALKAGLKIAFCGVLARPAWAGVYPDRLLRIFVPFAPGGGGDTLARLLATRLGPVFGQVVIVENKPGASAAIATSAVAKAAPDGYSVLLTVPLLVQAPELLRSVPYAVSELTPVIDLVSSPLWLATSTSAIAATTLKGFVEEVKANPKKHSYASIGEGSSSHLLSAQLNEIATLDLIHVPYKGSAPASLALITGEVSVGLLDHASLKSALAIGKVRLLAVTGARRTPLSPETPTFSESGYPGFELGTWAGLFVPSKTPKEIVAKLHDTVARILGEAEFEARLRDLGFVPGGASQEGFAKQVASDQQLWATLIKKAGLRPN